MILVFKILIKKGVDEIIRITDIYDTQIIGTMYFFEFFEATASKLISN